MIGEIIGAGLGAAGAAIQHGYNEDAMNLQAQLNEQAAQRNQERNKDMWNYTNYENQVAHMKAAGLNPALIYGNGGQSGQTAGGQNSGVNAIGGNEISAGAQAASMGIQGQMLESQIEVNKAQAAKLNADAAKTSGVDTKLSEAEIQYKHSLQALTENQAAGASWDYNKNQALIENLVANTKLLNAQTNESKVNADVKNKEIINRTLETMQGINESKQRMLLMKSQGKLNEAQAKQISEAIMQEWTKIAQGLS